MRPVLEVTVPACVPLPNHSSRGAYSDNVSRSVGSSPVGSSLEVTEMRGRITNGKVAQYQVKMKVGFRLED